MDKISEDRSERPSVLFVCLGNICRSPLAEAAFRAAAVEAGLQVVVDSAGTGGWHVGEPPDRRAQVVARRHGLDISGFRGRQVNPSDFRRFDLVFALDADNLAGLRAIEPSDGTAEVCLLLDLVPGRTGQGVHDPYYGGTRDSRRLGETSTPRLGPRWHAFDEETPGQAAPVSACSTQSAGQL